MVADLTPIASASPVEPLDDEPDMPRWIPTPVVRPHEPSVAAVLAAPVEPTAVRAPGDRIRCLPYKATFAASSCLERQRAAKQQKGQAGAVGGAWRPDHKSGHYEKCRGCAIGETVRERLSS